MKAAVITFPGSNNDDDCLFTLKQVFEGQVDSLWHKETRDLGEYSLVLLPGGFSYGDYLRCGAIAAVSPIMAQVKEYANNGGFVVGPCNGFQILCESRLLPGALAPNESLNFICKDVFIRVESKDSPWTCELTSPSVLKLPIAHGEGRYILSDAEYNKMKSNGQILFTYVNEKGESDDNANPNGSCFSIAGVCNERKNVLGLMPHPERATDLRSKDGMGVWRSILKTISENHS